MFPFYMYVSFTLTTLLPPSRSAPKCGYEDATNTTYVCDCNGVHKCHHATVTCMNHTACRVECSKTGSCYGAHIDWPDAPGLGTLICDSVAMNTCRDVNFPIPNPYEDLRVICDQWNECSGAHIYCPEFANCHVTCSYNGACSNANILWSMNDVQSVLECTYGTDVCLGTNLPPSVAPTASPTHAPSIPTSDPTASPSTAPTTFTMSPTADPTSSPTAIPTVDPTFDPSTPPTVYPTAEPTISPSGEPTFTPTSVAMDQSSINHQLIIEILSTVIVVLCICCCLLITVVSVGKKKFSFMVNPKNERIAGVQSDTDTYTNQTDNVTIEAETAVEPGPGAAITNDSDRGALRRVHSVSTADTEPIAYAAQVVTPREVEMMDIASYARQKSMSLVQQTENVFEVQQWAENVLKLPRYFDAFISNGYESMDFIKEICDREELEEIGISCKEHQIIILKAIEKWKCDQK